MLIAGEMLSVGLAFDDDKDDNNNEDGEGKEDLFFDIVYYFSAKYLS